MPFGLTPAPGIFQKYLNLAFFVQIKDEGKASTVYYMFYICFQEVSKFSACLNLPDAYQGDSL